MTNIVISSLGMFASMFFYKWRYSAKPKTIEPRPFGGGHKSPPVAGGASSALEADTEEEEAFGK